MSMPRTPATERLDALWVPSHAMSDQHVVFDELRIAFVESFSEDGPYYGNVAGERTGAIGGSDWTKAAPLDEVKLHLAHMAIGQLLALLHPESRARAHLRQRGGA